MRQTLFFIPHELAGIPIFGFGWLLGLWILVSGLLAWRTTRKQGGSHELVGMLPVLAIVAAVIVFLIPRIEEPILPGWLTLPPSTTSETGLPIRGYGVLLLTAVVSGVLLAVYRAQRMGLEADTIFSLAFAMFVTGIVGARLFFVIQYWDTMQGQNLTETLRNIFNVVQGGLVVYGSLIGAMVGFAYFCWKHQLPALALADLIAPSLALGLAIGRVGCLMNGCCYGGPCSYPWAITFPPQSPPYSEQAADGTFLGIDFAEPADAQMGVQVARVTAGSVADAAGITANARIVSLDGYEVNSLDNVKSVLSRATSEVVVTLDSGRSIVLANPRPARSQPIHPTQIYSALNATLLCLFALALYPFRQRDGQVIAVLLTLYAITRFLLEVIRTDEGSFGGTGLTISQNVSILMAVGLAVLWASIYLRPAKLVWPRNA